MSKAVAYTQFCKRYDLDVQSSEAKQQYSEHCRNLDLFNDITEKKNWGGARAGAGRKTKYSATKVKRIPENYEKVIDALIQFLDEHAELDGEYHKPAESEAVFFRSLVHKKQEIKFKVSPL